MANFQQFIALLEAAANFPNRPHVATLVRWSLKGVGPRRVKLQTWKVGGRRYTTQEAIDRFVAQLSEENATAERLSARRGESIAEDERQLNAEGIV